MSQAGGRPERAASHGVHLVLDVRGYVDRWEVDRIHQQQRRCDSLVAQIRAWSAEEQANTKDLAEGWRESLRHLAARFEVEATKAAPLRVREIAEVPAC